MKNLKYSALLILSIFLFSCGDEGSVDTTEVEAEQPAVEVPAPPCTYTLGENATSVYWTAFKHTGKVGVKGKMDSVVVSGTETASSAMDALARGKVDIYTGSINSKDEVRDKKLVDIYFGSMANTQWISGTLQSWEGSETEGTCTFSLTMNDSEQTVNGAYIVDDATVQIRFTIEPNNWGAEDAIAKLGEACAEKHTGEDGKTVFWPDVELLIEVVLSKDCPDPV